MDKRQLCSITKELEASAIVPKTRLILTHRPREQHRAPVTSPGFGSAVLHMSQNTTTPGCLPPKKTACGPKTPFQCFSHIESSQMRKQAGHRVCRNHECAHQRPHLAVNLPEEAGRGSQCQQEALGSGGDTPPAAFPPADISPSLCKDHSSLLAAGI